jgi:putative endonuclease
MKAKGGYTYILTNQHHTVLYTGVTANLHSRLYEHKHLKGSHFTFRYNVVKLVYFEYFDSIEEAIKREKRLKKYKRKWKEELIQSFNPEWRDLSDEITDMI